MEPVILASASPLRQQYMTLLKLPFIAMPSFIDENTDSSLSPEEAAIDLARRKVMHVSGRLSEADPVWIAGADTMIHMGGKIYGKPVDRNDAFRILSLLQGRTHEVISGVALYNRESRIMDSRLVTSSVSFNSMTAPEIEWYLDSGEWQGAAGAYRIQGLASCFITEIKGSYSAIAGLPICEFYGMLRSNGYPYGSQGG